MNRQNVQMHLATVFVVNSPWSCNLIFHYSLLIIHCFMQFACTHAIERYLLLEQFE
jgi:hypothetical protein